MHDEPGRLRDRLDRAFGFLALVCRRLRAGRRFCAARAFALCNLSRRRLRAGRRFCAACAFAVCNLACGRGPAAAFGRIFLAIDRPDMWRISIEIWPADPKLLLVRIDPLPQHFACGESLQTGLTLDAHEIDGKPVAIAAAAAPAVK